MKRLTFTVILVLSLLACFELPASAQTSGQIVDTTIPVDTDVRAALDAWLANDPPVASVPYYAITYAKSDGLDTLVSLAGLNIGNPADVWNLMDNAIWLGSVRVDYYGEVTPLFPQEQARALKVLAMPVFSAGGGAYVRFPWQTGKGMLYGVKGVHAGAYGVSNGVAVDFVGGADIGSNIASATVYASVPGEIDYVCEDDTSVAVRVYSDDTSDYFAYAHLVDNANLELEHVFTANAVIGTTVYGSFDDNCGYAEQQDNHYHLHWVFQPANGAFRAEGCILNIATQNWNCNGSTIQPNKLIYHTVNYADDDPTGSTQVTFFDQLLVGLISIFDEGVVKLLPEHNSPTQLLQILSNGIVLVFRIAFVLVKGNFNLGPIMAMLAFAIAYKGIFAIVWLVLVVLRAVKSLVPVA